MKKLNTFFFSLSTSLMLQTASAGNMGAMPASETTPYFGGEANYTWRQINAPTINEFKSTTSNQPWGFRVSAGLRRFYTEKLALTAEVGGGYYGKTSISSPRSASNGSISVNGYDFLVGILYPLDTFDLFAKIGFMGENVRMDFTRYSLAELYNGNFIRGKTRNKASNAELLPELSVGGIYNMNQNLGVVLTYMHVFGSTMQYKINGRADIGSGIERITTVNFRNPTLDSILLGIRYYLV